MDVASKVGMFLVFDPKSSGVLLRAACNATSVVYPVYSTFKAIEKKEERSKAEQWLTYWSVYASLTLFEANTDSICSWFPYYYHLKLALLLWLQLPQTEGARVLYHQYMRPFFSRYEPKIDIVLQNISGFLAAMYTLNKGTIDAAKETANYAIKQARAFLSWFLSDQAEKPKIM